MHMGMGVDASSVAEACTLFRQTGLKGVAEVVLGEHTGDNYVCVHAMQSHSTKVLIVPLVAILLRKAMFKA